MSHITTVEVKIKDLKILEKVCKKLGHPVKIAGKGERITEKLYGSQTATGDASFHPSSFQYPVVVDSEEGKCSYDSYGGKSTWQSDLHKVQQEYSTEKAAHEAKMRGYTVERKEKQDGTVELVCSM